MAIIIAIILLFCFKIGAAWISASGKWSFQTMKDLLKDTGMKNSTGLIAGLLTPAAVILGTLLLIEFLSAIL